jgi:hypothetical protein
MGTKNQPSHRGLASVINVTVVSASLLSLALSACTKNNPIFCDDSSQCPDGEACAIDKKVCANDEFSLDRTPYFDDGTRLWSTSAAPTLNGSTSQSSATIEVLRDDQVIATPAQISSGQWTLQLPAGAIRDTDTELKIHLIGKDGTLEFKYVFAVDDKPPTIAIVPSTTLDESKDVVTFNAIGEPSHAHQSFPVVMDGTHCAQINKYGYLMDPTPPLYAVEDQRNPVAWNVHVVSKVAIDATKSRYRINRIDKGDVLPWTPMVTTKVTDGHDSSVAITRDVSPQVAVDGNFTIDWEVVDWAGRKTMTSGCWTQTIYAAPLATSALTLSSMPPTGIGSWLLNALPAVSALINGTTPTQAMETTITNGTAEDVIIEVNVNAPIVEVTRDTQFFAQRFRTTNFPVFEPGYFCDVNAPLHTAARCLAETPDQHRSSATVPGVATWLVEARDVSNTILPTCISLADGRSRCTVPKRNIGDAPQSFRLVASILSLPQLSPIAGTIGEFTSITFKYTGIVGEPYESCDAKRTDPVEGTYCSKVSSWTQVVYLASATVIMATPGVTAGNLRGPSLGFTSMPLGGVLHAPTYSVNSRAIRPLVWNGGSR